MTSIVISIKIRIYLIVWRVPPFPIHDDDANDGDDDDYHRYLQFYVMFWSYFVKVL